MKTPEEIKKGMYCCYGDPYGRECDECPYDSIDEKYCDCYLGADVREYIQQLEAAQPKWISVEDRMPEREVLAANFAPRTYGYKEYIIGYVSREKCTEPGKCYAENDYEILYDVTHWMSLPDAPKEGT